LAVGSFFKKCGQHNQHFRIILRGYGQRRQARIITRVRGFEDSRGKEVGI